MQDGYFTCLFEHLFLKSVLSPRTGVILWSQPNAKEEITMKTVAVNRTARTTPAYPNAASRRYFLHRLLDGALALATVAGVFTALVFLILM
jgi:hypothetical protein